MLSFRAIFLWCAWLERGQTMTQPVLSRMHRRTFFQTAITSLVPSVLPISAYSNENSDASSLVVKLATRDAHVLTRPTFNIPPAVQNFPSWFRGDWDTTIEFDGFEFPSIRGLTKKDILADFELAGFQKLGIAQLVDVVRMILLVLFG